MTTDADRAARALTTGEVAALLHRTPGELDAWRRQAVGPPWWLLDVRAAYDRDDLARWLLDVRGGASLPA